MKHIPIGIFAVGALMLLVFLFRKFATGYGNVEATDAVAVLVLAGVAHLIINGSGRKSHEHQG